MAGKIRMTNDQRMTKLEIRRRALRSLGGPLSSKHLVSAGSADIPVCGFPELSSSVALFSGLRDDNLWGLESPQNPQTGMSALRERENVTSGLRHSGFGFLSSFVIRHSSLIYAHNHR